MSIKQVNELRKAGQLAEAREMAAHDLAASPGAPRVARAMFWVLRDVATAADDGGRTDEMCSPGPAATVAVARV